jgi:tetratricopeptide (TPR) repeat protein
VHFYSFVFLIKKCPNIYQTNIANLNLQIMRFFLKIILGLFLFIPSVFAQKIQIKEAQKQFKAGNSEEAIAVLSPIEYLISNAKEEDKIYFYYVKGSALLDLSNKTIDSSKNLMLAAVAFNDLIQVEAEANSFKFTEQATKALLKIKQDLVNSANEDFFIQNFNESSDKFHQAYLIDKRDTLQLYNAAISYKNSDQKDLALKCYDELASIGYSGYTTAYFAFSKQNLKDEYFATKQERDATIQSGTHVKPTQLISSKKADIYKSIAMFYADNGFKEKALKAITQARSFDNLDQSLALIEANLYLVTKDFDSFDKLATTIIELDVNNADLVVNLGIKCQNELYYEGAENYFQKAIAIDSNNVNAYVNLSALLVQKSIVLFNKMNALGSINANKKSYEELKSQKNQIDRSVVPYLQKVVSIDPFNSSVSQLLATINVKNNYQHSVLASDE